MSQRLEVPVGWVLRGRMHFAWASVEPFSDEHAVGQRLRPDPVTLCGAATAGGSLPYVESTALGRRGALYDDKCRDCLGLAAALIHGES